MPIKPLSRSAAVAVRFVTWSPGVRCLFSPTSIGLVADGTRFVYNDSIVDPNTNIRLETILPSLTTISARLLNNIGKAFKPNQQGL